MKQLITCICILIIAASCELSSSIHSSGKKKPYEIIPQQEISSSDGITVFLTGNVLGSLKPCGCSGGQLGGLDRRPAVFNTVPKDKRLLIDTGSLIENQSQQSLFKFTIIIEALKYLDYDIVNLTKQDIEMSRQSGQLDSSSKEYISSYETDQKFPIGNRLEYELNGQKINISVVGFDPLERPIEDIKKVFPEEQSGKNVNILIINNESNEIISGISKLGVVDCLICPIKSDEPTVISDSGAKTLACAVGRFGRYISKLVINNAPDGSLKLSFDYIPVREEIKQDDYLKDLYKTYQDMVKDAGLLGENLRSPLDGKLKYVGSESCQSDDCHSEQFKHQFEYVVWKESGHANAYATLASEDVGSQYDPECIVCHVIGYKYESGFKTAETTPKLKNVGCEICHGPGSEHCKDPYNNKMKPIPDNKFELCLQCHTSEHDGDFAGHEEEKWELISHP